MAKLKSRGHMPLPFYPSFEEDDLPSSGFSRYVSYPRFSHGYWHVQNRLGVLVETHSWKDYATRVKTHYSTVLASMELLQQHGKEWVKAAQERSYENLAGKEVPLSFKKDGKPKTIDFPGYNYSISRSEVSGEDVIKYFPDKPETWKVPLYESLIPDLKILAPKSGYYVPGTQAGWVKQKLDLHGIRYQSFREPAPVTMEVFRATKSEFSSTSFEGRQILTVEGTWSPEEVTLPPGSLFVPIEQKRAYLVIHLFEPRAQDSFLSWGFFNPAFERKEYMEKYVAEDVAKEMLKDPVVKAEFEKRLEDPAFAKDPRQRVDFFYRKHPSWDKKFNLYPVFRK